MVAVCMHLLMLHSMLDSLQASFLLFLDKMNVMEMRVLSHSFVVVLVKVIRGGSVLDAGSVSTHACTSALLPHLRLPKWLQLLCA